MYLVEIGVISGTSVPRHFTDVRCGLRGDLNLGTWGSQFCLCHQACRAFGEFTQGLALFPQLQDGVSVPAFQGSYAICRRVWPCPCHVVHTKHGACPVIRWSRFHTEAQPSSLLVRCRAGKLRSSWCQREVNGKLMAFDASHVSISHWTERTVTDTVVRRMKLTGERR